MVQTFDISNLDYFIFIEIRKSEFVAKTLYPNTSLTLKNTPFFA